MVAQDSDRWPQSSLVTVVKECAYAEAVAIAAHVSIGANLSRPSWHYIGYRTMEVQMIQLTDFQEANETNDRVIQSALRETDTTVLARALVAMDDGVLTLMGKIRDYNKVISIDLAFDIDDAGEIAIEIREIRVGVLPIPRWLVDEALAEARLELAEQLAKAQRGEPAVMGAVNMNDLAGLMKRIITMLDGRRVPAEITVKAGARHRTIIQQIEIDDGKLTLTCEAPGE